MRTLQSEESRVLPAAELRRLAGELLDGSGAPASRAEVWALGAEHPRFEVRLTIVREAALHPEDPEARRLLAWAVNDVDDRVALTALGAVADQLDMAAMDDLLDAAGRSLAALDGVVSSGCDLRHRAVLDALGRLLRAHPDPSGERRRLSGTGYDQRQSRRDLSVDTTGMVEVQPGPGRGRGFWIDMHPVTWGEYQRFVAAVEEYGPLWRHPGHPAGHDHDVLRHLDAGQLERLADHPVSGVTWYDAWAYAAWRGKKLPAVSQWELAAGALSSRYPWGDAPPTAGHAHFGTAGSVDEPLERLTAPAGSHPLGASAAGVHDLAGNVWEWTRSRWLDEEDLSPFVGAAWYTETLGDWTLTACVKGGSWASTAADLEGTLRAGKHVLQRGPETGFRCVLEPYGE